MQGGTLMPCLDGVLLIPGKAFDYSRVACVPSHRITPQIQASKALISSMAQGVIQE